MCSTNKKGDFVLIAWGGGDGHLALVSQINSSSDDGIIHTTLSLPTFVMRESSELAPGSQFSKRIKFGERPCHVLGGEAQPNGNEYQACFLTSL